MPIQVFEGSAAKALGRKEKWELLSPFLRQHGRESLAYSTLQDGMEYFVTEDGYIAYTTVHHPVFAPKTKKMVLSDPLCAPEKFERLVKQFLEKNPRAAFVVISESCAAKLRAMRFKVNCVGYEPEIAIQTYNTKGNWKDLDLIKRARNEAKREGLIIREETAATLNASQMKDLSAKWISTKKVNDREIWIYARRPVLDHEEDVRKFVAYDKEGRVAGFIFYDPMYRDGQVYGYAATIARSDEKRYGRLATAINMEAAEKFKAEGKATLNLLLAPFVKLHLGKYNDDFGVRLFFKLTAKYGDNIYNFQGLSFNKSKYRGTEKPMYYASNSLWPSNDVYLAFLSADIARSYFSTFGRLVWGMLTAWRNTQQPA